MALNEIQQLALHDGHIFAASSKSLYRLDLNGSIVWQNNFHYLKTKNAQYGFPFSGIDHGAHRVFMGIPSRLIFQSGHLVMASSLGAMGLFDLENGRLKQVLGDALGFGPKIGVANGGIIALTRFGTLVKFR